MEEEVDLDFERLKKVFIILIPLLLIIAGVGSYFYKNSVDILEISIVEKEMEFDDYKIFYVTSETETLLATEDIYNSLEPGSTYIVGAKGWNFAGSYRKLISVYRKSI